MKKLAVIILLIGGVVGWLNFAFLFVDFNYWNWPSEYRVFAIPLVILMALEFLCTTGGMGGGVLKWRSNHYNRLFICIVSFISILISYASVWLLAFGIYYLYSLNYNPLSCPIEVKKLMIILINLLGWFIMVIPISHGIIFSVFPKLTLRNRNWSKEETKSRIFN
jgi:hypothetical protein